ncbi:MAG: ATP-binding protein [Bacteroidales bacterium]|nr:ATP-binding protein [Bacteroidales bacterium]MDT8430103.1 ATP-binding protein [Bacteroidales bacterium]
MIRLSLKNKLLSGFGFLIFMIVLLWIVGGYFIYDLSNRSAAMLAENYQTVKSARHMVASIDEMKNQQIRFFIADGKHFDEKAYELGRSEFLLNLEAAENNITEQGEEQVIQNLKSAFALFSSQFDQIRIDSLHDNILFLNDVVPLYTSTRDEILTLWDMNMDAISQKNSMLKSTAHRAFVFISMIGTICFLISALFFFRYPRKIAGPIGEMISGIIEIANRNYSKRLSFNSNDELGELAEAFNNMAAKLDEYEHSNLSELLFDKKRIDTIINNMHDAIVGINDKNEIIFSNATACQLLDIEEKKLTGRDAREISSQNPVFRAIIHDIINESEPKSWDFKPVRLMVEEEVRYFTREVLNVNVPRTGEGEPVYAGMVIVLKNITHFLEQDEAKTNFIATISHELKTPISSMRLNLKLLDDSRIGSLNREQMDIVSALKTENGHMLKLISELLDLAQVESGNIALKKKKIRPDQLIGYIRETAENHASGKKLRISYKVDPGLPFIYVDEERTRWVMMNLLSNAIQYSDDGGEILVAVEEEHGRVVFSVQDHGPGIDAAYHELIFEKFFRVPGSERKGTGLGLAISRELITNQKGKIWVNSTPGSGSTFSFSLPAYTETEN